MRWKVLPIAAYLLPVELAALRRGLFFADWQNLLQIEIPVDARNHLGNSRPIER
jgi:hypothetical protein